MTSKSKIKVAADAVIHFLKTMGIETLHNYPGGAIAPLLDACTRFGIRVITSRHEQGAGYAALAQAKITGLPGIVAVTSGPGATNVITPVADAFFDSIPLLVFTGQVGTGDLKGDTGLRQKGFQEVDTPLLMQAITKAQFQPKSAEEFIAVLPQAWQLALDGRRGPVSIDVPMTAQRSTYECPIPLPPAIPEAKLPPESDAFFQSLLSAITTSHRPVLICGNGMIDTKLCQHLSDLQQLWAAPVSHSLLGLGTIDSASHLTLGFHGHTGSQLAGRTITESDLILVLGSRLDVRQTGSVVEAFAPSAKIFRIDFDSTELEHSRIKSDETLNTPLALALPHLITTLESAHVKLPALSSWHEHINALKASCGWTYEEFPGISPVSVVERVSEKIIAPVICVTGVGTHQHWVARHFRFCYPKRQFFTSAGHGAMGYDLPTAIGAAFHAPETQILCIVGDGSLQMNIQELGVIQEHQLNVKIIVLDNQRLGLVSQFQLMNWDTDTACGNKHSPDFLAIAKAYGLTAFYADTEAAFSDQLDSFIESPSAALFHIRIDERHDISPMLMGGQTLDKMWPYYNLDGTKND